MTQHFNELTEAETERLAILAEECAEVIREVGKILRHGYESTNPKRFTSDNEYPETNRWALERELGDVMRAIVRMQNVRDVNAYAIMVSRDSKSNEISYLHHQNGAETK